MSSMVPSHAKEVVDAMLSASSCVKPNHRANSKAPARFLWVPSLLTMCSKEWVLFSDSEATPSSTREMMWGQDHEE